MQVVMAPRAEAQIRTIDAWWRRNRNDSPDLFFFRKQVGSGIGATFSA